MTPIDRKALVRRHNPELTEWKPDSPLSLGNGDFAFTADFTGLQTFSDNQHGSVPLCTMSQWGFHRYPGAERDYSVLKLKEYQYGNTKIGYMTDPEGQECLFNDLRENPHRFHLGKIGLHIEGITDREENPEGPDAGSLPGNIVKGIGQKLDLWTGTMTSRFTFDGQPVKVSSVCHPGRALLSFRIESPLVAPGKIGLDLRFPYGSHGISGADWDRDHSHKSRLTITDRSDFLIEREMDDCHYAVRLSFFESGDVKMVRQSLHHWIFRGDGNIIEFSLLFSPGSPGVTPIPDFNRTAGASADSWESFWNSGAAISFEGSTDPRAPELERRVILSQYLLAIQSLGSLPPAETGLTCNSWYGKFHLEMHPWHALHGLLWGRSDLVEQSLSWYEKILPGARKRAGDQGFNGIRWPKMTDPSGNFSPSPIGCLLCWQQPHLILFAELLRRLDPSRELLRKYSVLVFETADFMADYPLWDEKNNRYVLGPPLIPAQENHAPEETLNPLFELEYWRWGLNTALRWKKLLDLPVPSKWNDVLEKLSPCPVDPFDPGRYSAHENCSDSYGRYGTDHPSMLLGFGFLPPGTTDPAMVSATYDAVMKHWKRETMWGWDFPALAMTLARLGRKREAVDMLLMKSPKNTYLANGHNRQEGHDDLPLYLPGNGALLLALAMMAAGWDGSSGESPGFPDDGSWKVRWEGLARYI